MMSTIVAVVPTADDAKQEVERLSRVNAGKDCEYFSQSSCYYPEDKGAPRSLMAMGLWSPRSAQSSMGLSSSGPSAQAGPTPGELPPP